MTENALVVTPTLDPSTEPSFSAKPAKESNIPLHSLSNYIFSNTIKINIRATLAVRLRGLGNELEGFPAFYLFY